MAGHLLHHAPTALAARTRCTPRSVPYAHAFIRAAHTCQQCCLALPHAGAYGSPDDLRRFVDRAHSLGLCVIVDVVLHHGWV